MSKRHVITPENLNGNYKIILASSSSKRLTFELSVKDGITNTSYVLSFLYISQPDQYFMDLHAAITAYNEA